jgi:hypothetical protein
VILDFSSFGLPSFHGTDVLLETFILLPKIWSSCQRLDSCLSRVVDVAAVTEDLEDLAWGAIEKPISSQQELLDP